ncbi:hypothetical protein LB505_011616 [Fusarium chuoi]|nr:hypothetical protein LB505_011616 [Fusarium chuoi]
MATDWRELSRVSLPSPARASSPSSSQSQPPQKNSLACERAIDCVRHVLPVQILASSALLALSSLTLMLRILL